MKLPLPETPPLGPFKFGVKALGTYPSKGKATSGSKGSVLNIAGMQFATNMWVYCDKVRETVLLLHF